MWRPLDSAEELAKDQGWMVLDQGTFMWPTRPMEPLFRALEHTARQAIQVSAHQSIFSSTLANVDIVIDRHTWAKLFDFVNGVSSKFSFVVELVGQKVVFVSRGGIVRQRIVKFSGYGKTFLQEYTKFEGDVRGSASHHRILKFRFAGLGYLLRLDCDGCMPRNSSSTSLDGNVSEDDDECGFEGEGGTGSKDPGSRLQDTMDVDDVPDVVDTPESNVDQEQTEEALKVRPAGRVVDHWTCVDIKTRSIYGTLDLSVVLPRLWMSQTPTLIVAYNRSGRFEDVRIDRVGAQLDEWEDDNQELLAKLDALMRRIVCEARGTKSGKCRVSFEEDVGLVMSELGFEYEGALPDDLCKEVASA